MLYYCQPFNSACILQVFDDLFTSASLFIGWGYKHDRRADKNVTDDLCSLIKLCFAFIMVNFFDLMCLIVIMLKII